MKAPREVWEAYLTLLEQAILDLRMRVRYGEGISAAELHDFLDALHNVPRMLRKYGGWHVEENIDRDLARYDERWMEQSGSELRRSLIALLVRCKNGEFDLYP